MVFSSLFTAVDHLKLPRIAFSQKANSEQVHIMMNSGLFASSEILSNIVQKRF